MGKFSILLCDSDEVYAKRLAYGLQRQFREQVSVRTFSGSFDADGQEVSADLLLGSRLPGHNWRLHHPNCIYIWLDEGDGAEHSGQADGGNALTDPETDGASDVWQDSIFKYQPVSKIARTLQSYLPVQTGKQLGCQTKLRQLWYGVVSPTRHPSMLPFACSLASCLGEKKRVLLLVLMEFSGIFSLLELRPGQGMETFLLRLRQRDSLERIPFPMVHVVGDFDLLNGPDNPMILYELNEADILRLIERIQICRQYDAVVWVGGNMMRGIGEFFRQSEMVFAVERGDRYSQCCQQEFMTFFEKMNQKDMDHLRCVRLPVLAGTQTGEHLLWQWNHSVIGEIARKAVEGESLDGADDGVVSKEDFRTVGPEWRDFRPGADGEDPGTD